MNELRPPPEYAHLRHHYVRSKTMGHDEVFYWYDGSRGGGWITPGSRAVKYPSALADGWDYVGPAVAITLSDEQIAMVAQALCGGIDPRWHEWIDDARAALKALIGEVK